MNIIFNGMQKNHQTPRYYKWQCIADTFFCFINLVVFTNNFSGPDRTIGPVCVCVSVCLCIICVTSDQDIRHHGSH